MDHPGRGAPYSVRTLAEASGCKPGLIGGLLSGRQKTADVDEVIAIVETLGVTINPLFAPPSSPERDDPSTRQPPTDKE
jgi:transcriptional regulator with XRE-family HTH domain